MFYDIKEHQWTQEEYFAFDAVSNSLLKRMQDDPSSTFDKFYPNESMKLGSAFDQMILEPERFKNDWTVLEGETKSPSGENQSKFAKMVLAGEGYENAYRESYVKYDEAKAKALYKDLESWFMLKQNPNTISPDMNEFLLEMKQSIESIPKAVELIGSGKAQTCFTGRHEGTGLLVKGMLDLWDADSRTETDLKTTSLKWSQVTKRWLEDRNYDVQRAIYAGLTGAEKSHLIVTRTVPKWRTRVFDVTNRINLEMWRGGKERETAFEKADRLLNEFNWRKSHNEWSHYPDYYRNGGLEVL